MARRPSRARSYCPSWWPEAGRSGTGCFDVRCADGRGHRGAPGGQPGIERLDVAARHVAVAAGDADALELGGVLLDALFAGKLEAGGGEEPPVFENAQAVLVLEAVVEEPPKAVGVAEVVEAVEPVVEVGVVVAKVDEVVGDAAGLEEADEFEDEIAQ